MKDNCRISFIGNDQELFTFIRECLEEFSFDFSVSGGWDEFKSNSADAARTLVMLSPDAAHLIGDEEFTKFSKAGKDKIPVFTFSSGAAVYRETDAFKENLASALKKAWHTNVLPRKQMPFEQVKLGEKKPNSRNHERISISTPIVIECVGSGFKMEGSLRNLSAGGISVKTASQIADCPY
ncbi:PilZ domain-containing protein, partial [bacterium]|nr:PilZ domain-containing protein [bacterium]MBU3955866.1 PilZ domain-containing protein [bacterium]